MPEKQFDGNHDDERKVLEQNNVLAPAPWVEKQGQLWEEASRTTEVPPRLTQKMQGNLIDGLLVSHEKGRCQFDSSVSVRNRIRYFVSVISLLVYFSVGPWLITESANTSSVGIYIATGLFCGLGFICCYGGFFWLISGGNRDDSRRNMTKNFPLQLGKRITYAGATNIRRALIKGLRIDLPIMKDLFMLAISDGKLNIVDLLIFRGIDLNFIYYPSESLPKNKEFLSGLTPLMAAAAVKSNATVVERLLAVGARPMVSQSVQAAEAAFSTVLEGDIKAAFKLQIIKLLLTYNIEITERDLEYAWDNKLSDIAPLLEDYARKFNTDVGDEEVGSPLESRELALAISPNHTSKALPKENENLNFEDNEDEGFGEKNAITYF